MKEKRNDNGMKKIAAALICAAFLTACVSGGDSAVTDETVSEAPVLGDSFTETVTEASSETTVTTTETTAETTTETTTVFIQREIPFEDTVQNAYERLMASFETESGIVYPDDYGGVYSYAGTLFVNITENEPSESYTSVLGDYTCVRYETVERSFNRLTEISLEAKELLDEEFGVDEYFVDVPDKAQNFLKTVETKSFTLDELSISMAETED